MFCELKFEFVQTSNENTSLIDDADGAGARRLHQRRRRPERRARRPPVHPRRQLRLHHPQARAERRPAVRGWPVGQLAADERERHVHVLQPGDFEAGQAQMFTRRVGDPLVSYTQYQAGWYLQDDFRLSKNLQPQPRPAPGAADARRRQVEPRAARRLHLDGGEGHHPRRLGHLLRLVRLRHLRADAPRRRRAPARPDHRHPDLSASITTPGDVLPPSLIRTGRPPRPAAGAAGVHRLRQEPDRRRSALPRRLHVDPRLPHAALGERQRAGRRRAARSDGRQHHARSSSTGERAQDRITVGLNWRVPSRRIFTQPDVPVRQHAEPRRLGAEPARQHHQSRRRLGPVGPGRAPPPVLHG